MYDVFKNVPATFQEPKQIPHATSHCETLVGQLGPHARIGPNHGWKVMRVTFAESPRSTGTDEAAKPFSQIPPITTFFALL